MGRLITLFLLFIEWTLFLSSSWSLSDEYKEIVEKNLFSSERRYFPSPVTSKNGNIKISEIQRGLIFLGIFRRGEKKWAIIEIKPFLKKKWEIPERKRIFSVGDEIGPCRIENIEKHKVIFGEPCEELILSLRQSPERNKPAPPPAPSTTQTVKKESSSSNKKKINASQKEKNNNKINPFKLLIQKNLKKQLKNK